MTIVVRVYIGCIFITLLHGTMEIGVLYRDTMNDDIDTDNGIAKRMYNQGEMQ